jgi:uncharacterized membrane protein YphA (DoxX/SURF4 family)
MLDVVALSTGDFMTRATVLRMARMALTWLLSLFLAFVFVVQGVAKFSATSGWARAFQHWGYPVWFRQSVGAAEIVAGALVLIPMTAPIGATTIIALMIGGIATHVIHGDPQKFQSELGQIVFAAALLALRWSSVRRLLTHGATNP